MSTRLALTLAAGLMTLSGSAQALDQVTFGTNWKAEAEHGGFYQAVATGIYEKHGLEVTIRPGGPQVNHAQLLAAGKLDFNMGGNAFEAGSLRRCDVQEIDVLAGRCMHVPGLSENPTVGVDHAGAIILLDCWSTSHSDHIYQVGETPHYHSLSRCDPGRRCHRRHLLVQRFAETTMRINSFLGQSDN
jgi:hypothetical protein